MQITTKSRYALRALVDIAQYQGPDGCPVRRIDIGVREDFSQDYLEQLLGRLRDSHVVESVRGPGGGYRLARPANEISIWDIIKDVEAHPFLTPCVEEESPDCSRFDECPSRNLWRYLQWAMEKCLSEISLQDILDGKFNQYATVGHWSQNNDQPPLR